MITVGYKWRMRLSTFMLIFSFIGLTVSLIEIPTTQAIAKNQFSQTGASAPMSKPSLNDDALLTWATQAATAAYTYDFKNYKNEVQSTQKYFTDKGWQAFSDALEKSNNLNVVQNKKLVAFAVATGKGVILEKSVKNGKYRWKVQIPVLATYENESRIIKQNLLVTMIITRTSTAGGTDGIGISHFVAQIAPKIPQPTATPMQSSPMMTPTPTPSSNPMMSPPATPVPPSQPNGVPPSIQPSTIPPSSSPTSSPNVDNAAPTPAPNLHSQEQPFPQHPIAQQEPGENSFDTE